MDFNTYTELFRKKAIEHNYEENIIEKCLNYSKNLFNKNLPVIYSSEHLCELIGFNHSYLKRIKHSNYFFYRHFQIDKKNGGKRLISEPLPNLKNIQDFILREILYPIKVSEFCKSYVPNKKFREHLMCHCNRKIILTLDIKDFFPSLKYNLVLIFFSRLGYAFDVCKDLTHLCCFSKKEDLDTKEKYFLPQGAATSPYLSNLLLKDFDNIIGAFCQKNNIYYSRYADDLAFSGENLSKDNIIHLVTEELSKIGLELNSEKTKCMLPNVTQIISGVVLNQKIQLPKSERNKIRQIIYFIKKNGLQGHLKRIHEVRENYIPHLLGRIQYGLDLNKEDNELIDYKKYIIENFLKHKESL